MHTSRTLNEAMTKALSVIHPDNGFITSISHIYKDGEKVPSGAKRPYLLQRIEHDRRQTRASVQATRIRTFALEVVFSHLASDDELNAVHEDILRALGIGQDPFERSFPGMSEEEDEAEYTYPTEGSTNRSITVLVPVTYVATYR